MSLARILLTWLLAGLCGVALVRLAPGFGSDERELDARLSGQSIEALRAKRDGNVLETYGQFLLRAARGDLGTSESLNAPVAGLLGERLPMTLRSAGGGLTAAWIFALALITLEWGLGQRMAGWFGSAAAELLLATPLGVVALALFLLLDGWTGAPGLGIALAIFPHLFRNQAKIVAEAAQRPFVLSAHARGLSPLRVFVREVLPGALPQMLALAGMSATLAMGASIPIEAICDSPGVGQLAWKAVTSRDLPLLLPLVLAVTGVTLLSNGFADLAMASRRVAQ